MNIAGDIDNELIYGDKKKRVVVVGGGITGAYTAKALEEQCLYTEVTLIDQKGYVEMPWTRRRCMVEPGFAEMCILLHEEYLKSTKIVIGTAASVTDGEVILENRESVSYDYLVIATGSTFEGPTTREGRIQQYEADCKKIRNAGTILIIGGGPAGLELAGELSVDFPQKNLIIVHGGVRLIDFLGLKASKKALEWLNKRGVNVYFEERITEDGLPGPEDEGDGLYTMSSGKTVTADCHFLCTGKKINSSWLKGTAFEDSLDERGFLKVDRSLMLEGHPNVFAVGYITNMKEMRQGLLAQKHAEVVAENIRKLSKGSNKIITYKPGPPIGMVSLGRSLAIAQMPWGTTLGRLPGMLKSKDLYVGKTRKALGFKS